MASISAASFVALLLCTVSYGFQTGISNRVLLAPRALRRERCAAGDAYRTDIHQHVVPGGSYQRQLLLMKADVSFSSSQSVAQSVGGVRTAFTKSIKKSQSILRSLPIIAMGLFLKLRLQLNRLRSDVQSAANAMEQGWTKRSSGGSLRRTIEVWIFAIRYIFKYVSTSFCTSPHSS